MDNMNGGPVAIAEIANRLPETIDTVDTVDDAAIIPRQPVTLKTLDLNWHPKLRQAVSIARQWQQRRRNQQEAGEVVNASMILVSGPPNKLLPGQRVTDFTGYGVGKTHIAKSCLWSECYMMDGEPWAPVGSFYEAGRLIENMTLTTPPSAEIRGGILVIDDVGTEGTIPFVAKESQHTEREARFFRIINYCYDRGVSVIITANMTTDKLAAHIGGRAWSRLQEMAPRGFIYDMTGIPDYRRKAGGR